MYNILLLSYLPSYAEGQQWGWEPGHALGGHYGAVVDMCWGVDGSCLLTASSDQTCRITAQNSGSWSELARPQVGIGHHNNKPRLRPHLGRLSHVKCCGVPASRGNGDDL